MTRRTIRAIHTRGDAQIVFLDTPGLHTSDDLLSEVINSAAMNALKEADLIIRFIDSSRLRGQEDERIDEILTDYEKKVIRVLSRADLVRTRELDPNMLAISSHDRRGISDLVTLIESRIPEGPWLYEEDMYTDQDIPSRIEEVVREAIFHFTGQEVPYSTYSEVSSLDRSPDGSMKALVYIHCETEAQKRILVGTGGAMISSIGKMARENLMKIFAAHAHLVVRVKVSPKWKKTKQSAMRALGMR